MKIVAGLIAVGMGAWFVVGNLRVAELKVDRRPWKLLSRKASIRVNRVLNVILGLWLMLGGVGLIVTGWKEFK
ncbi:MAG TPA: hypothetical protein VIP46_06475 [Pyrinomonadaceae bacterium]